MARDTKLAEGGTGMKDYEADYIYDVWRNGGNPDEVSQEEIPEDYDWVWDDPNERDLRIDPEEVWE